jgi:hypothetical protein
MDCSQRRVPLLWLYYKGVYKNVPNIKNIVTGKGSGPRR